MCGRYALHSNPEVVALQFGLAELPEFRPSYNICPGGDILAVTRKGASRHRWGFGNRIANARGESVAERPSFRDAFRAGRCLVPASGFYEWQTIAGQKHPWYLRPRDAALFGLAGITSLWQGVRSVSLITTTPNAVMEPIHDRMPVIITPQDYAAWLDPDEHDAERLMRFVRPYPAERMEGWPVSTRVNQPANDEPALLQRVAPRQSRLL
ncbi:MAG TPA: SOS response-associated peptidase [Burkholderiales bacterium]|nr:SOS response-associated peptidase [Burkholderiales bacterium]